MKKILSVVFGLTLGLGAAFTNATQSYAQSAPAPKEGPMFKFESGDSFDFGVLKRGPVAPHTF